MNSELRLVCEAEPPGSVAYLNLEAEWRKMTVIHMTIPKGLEGVLKIDPEIMHGDLCFAGTRVPLTVFLDNLAEGVGIDGFLKNYPSISRSQAEAVLRWENDSIRQAAGIQLSA